VRLITLLPELVESYESVNDAGATVRRYTIINTDTEVMPCAQILQHSMLKSSLAVDIGVLGVCGWKGGHSPLTAGVGPASSSLRAAPCVLSMRPR
jgi:hypothetical protein